MLIYSVTVTATIVFLCWRHCRDDKRGLSGTGQGNESIEDCQSATIVNNRELTGQERETRELIREQAEDIGTARDTNRTAEELIQKGEEILSRYRN